MEYCTLGAPGQLRSTPQSTSMRHPPYRSLSVVVLFLVSASAAWAADAPTFPDQEEIRAAAIKYLKAKAKGDVDTLRQLWTPEGEYIDARGQRFRAWEVIDQQIASQQTAEHDGKVTPPDSTLRLVTRDVAVEDGTTEDDASGQVVRFTAIWVRRDGRWLLDSLRESVATQPSPNDRLQPLSWILGEWVGRLEEATILVSSHWNEGGNFIVREFLVRSGDHEPVSGTQRIGWDATAGQIKSWTFDSQGGTGEGVWRARGDRWIVQSKEKTADGKVFSATSVYTPGDEDRFVWEVKSGSSAAEAALPPMRVEFRRAAEEPEN